MSVRAGPPFALFVDASGDPLDAGFVYIGVANQDPAQNPIAVFSDSALSVSVAQPIHTLAGAPVVNGTPVNLFVGGNYSLAVHDRNNVQVYTVPSAALAGGDITLAAGETLETQSGSSINMRDGSALNLGDGSGIGVPVVVAAPTRVFGNWVSSLGDNLGTNTERWGEGHIQTVLAPNNYGTNVTGFRDATEAASPLLALGLNQQTNIVACGRIGITGAIATNHFNVAAAANSGGNASVTFDEPVEDDAVIFASIDSLAFDRVIRCQIDPGGAGAIFRIYDGGVLTSQIFRFVVIGRPRGGVASPIS